MAQLKPCSLRKPSKKGAGQAQRYRADGGCSGPLPVAVGRSSGSCVSAQRGCGYTATLCSDVSTSDTRLTLKGEGKERIFG